MKKIVAVIITMVMVAIIGVSIAETWPDDITYFNYLESYEGQWPDGSLINFHNFKINYYEGRDRYDYVQYIEDVLPLFVTEGDCGMVITDPEGLVLEDGENYVVFLKPTRNNLEYDECIYKYDWMEFGVLYY